MHFISCVPHNDLDNAFIDIWCSGHIFIMYPPHNENFYVVLNVLITLNESHGKGKHHR